MNTPIIGTIALKDDNFFHIWVSSRKHRPIEWVLPGSHGRSVNRDGNGTFFMLPLYHLWEQRDRFSTREMPKSDLLQYCEGRGKQKASRLDLVESNNENAYQINVISIEKQADLSGQLERRTNWNHQTTILKGTFTTLVLTVIVAVGFFGYGIVENTQTWK